MRRFILQRNEDETGISGPGVVAEGIHFTGGKAVLHWLTVYGAVNVYDNMQVVIDLHGHGGKTLVVYLDGEEV